MQSILLILVGVVLAGVAGYSVSRMAGFLAQRPQDYAAAGPEFDLRRHLSGPILCEGVIYGPTGRVASRFVAEMEGRWDGDRGVLTEVFRYDSGVVQNRRWNLEQLTNGHMRATADDILGDGTGQQAGPALMLNYRLRLPESAGGHVVDVTDWMYLLENETIINRSQFRKFGIRVAELVATMRKLEN